MTDWADERAEQMCDPRHGKPLWDEKIGAMQERIAFALREARAKGIEEAAEIVDKSGHKGWFWIQRTRTAEAIRKLKNQP